MKEQDKLRMGPQQRGFRKESQRTKRVGVGPQQREFREEIHQAKQVGVAEAVL
ncbi:hypothetical protein [Staphylococcus lugdunensis]|nr:hypothetical protein [Staphylococcus lugdunensis]OFJ62134.1 PTS cellobiose transporter subunit IIBC [Staphylococcus sp. HMSC077E11]OFM46031.1 PTS cellobiose transporter subunit IIBC [Staphylococcus sp. HMSC077E12]OFR87959.1 PTS cellobiose transporter subunit IIBC [Staphylococcus sp. HMSC059F04]OHP74568.1 PTS cellobiose transporter subunit IIBC [Staphylococcus sp. HMSC062D12]OHP80718.1 PTS cellobiose transporter subunit IIBC [Staphylococcus sp. HMSC063A07]OHP91589.1 PTS cellobiose transport